MDDHEVRRRIRRAIDPGDGFPAPMLWERAVSRLAELPEPRRGPWHRLVVAAVVLAGVAAAGLLLLSRSEGSHTEVPAATGTATGRLPQPASTRTGTADYQFVSPSAGWLVEYGKGGLAHVLRTVDGGAHWTATSDLTGLAPFARLRFFDERQGLVIGPGSSASTTEIRVYSTVDGGAHWQATDGSGTAGTVRSAWFLTMREGWVLTGPRDGGSMSVYHTGDGGQRWDLLSGPAVEPLLSGLTEKVGIEFATPQDGWISGFSMDPVASVLLATHDGGHTWRQVDMPPPPGVTMTGKRVTGDLPTLFGTDGLLVASLYSPQRRPPGLPTNSGPGIPIDALYVYETHDGGRTWSFVRRLDQFGVSFEDATHWFQAGGGGMAFSNDAGRTWSAARVVPQPPGWNYSRPSFIGSAGWALLEQGPVAAAKPGASAPSGGTTPRYAVIRTTDAGAHWTEGELPPP